MILKFTGVGSAFAPREFYQTGAALVSDDRDEKCLLIDCGSDARFSLPEADIDLDEIDGVYVTHLHADHVGGLEWLGFCTYFNPDLPRPKLYGVSGLLSELWHSTLRGGMESLQGEIATLPTYFDVRPIWPNEAFKWRGIRLQPVQTVHVVSGYKIQYSYGLMITGPGVIDFDPPKGPPTTKVFFTGDTQFCPKQIEAFYEEAGLIFQDCETSSFRSTVHAHYDDLKTLAPETKAKMWLMHYQAGGIITDKTAKDDGFLGFVKRGQEFQL